MRSNVSTTTIIREGDTPPSELLDLDSSNIIESSSDDGNVAGNVFDKKFDTRWSAFGSGESTALEVSLPGNHEGRYVRIIGLGNEFTD